MAIQSDQQSVVLDEALEYWPSLGSAPGPAFEAFRSGAFSPKRDMVSLGFGQENKVWVAVSIKNAAFDDGRAGDPFVVTYDGQFVMGYTLFLVREDGLTENLVDYSANQPFDPAEWAVNRLRSPEFVLAPGETATVFAHLQLKAKGYPSLSLMRPDALAQQSLVWASGMMAFYAFAVSFLFVCLGFVVAMRSMYGVFFIALEVALLLHLAFGDGLVFRFFLPNHPELHHSIHTSVPLFAIFTTSMMMAFGFRLGQKPNYPMSSGLMACAAALFVMGLLAFLNPSAGWVLAAVIVVCVATLPGPFVPSEVYQREDVPGIGLKWVLIVSMVGVDFIMVWGFSGWSIENLSVRLPPKLAYAFVLSFLVVFFVYNLIALRKRHLTAIAARISALELEAEKSRQLLDTERAYIRARETASARQKQLATASHDIKQPLMSLRTTFDAIASDMDGEVRTRLAEAFAYLETLSKSYVDAALPEVVESADFVEKGDAPRETYALSVPLNTVRQMFNGEAVSKGIDLRVVDTSLETQAMPIVLMRILTNLVSNAVKYTDEGAVLIGVRRAGPEIWVCDTGRGMSAAEIDRFRTAYEKGDGSAGHGLGLSVCFELAAANEIGLTVTSTPGRGSVFRVSLAHHRPGGAL